MAKIDRYNGNVRAFAADSLGTERTVFGATTQSDTLDGNITLDLLRGWGIVGVNENPTKQDFNGLAFTLGQLLAYLHQRGVPEWNALQEFHSNSITQFGGAIYFCNTDDHVSATDPSSDTTNWDDLPTRLSLYTQAEVDASLLLKANIDNTYIKTEVDDKDSALQTNIDNTYTQAEITSILTGYIVRSEIPSEVGSLIKKYFKKSDSSAVLFIKTGNFTATTGQEFYAEVGGAILTIATGTAITMPTATTGTDYAVWLKPGGTLEATTSFTSPPATNARKIGGFHYAPGGNASAQAGGNSTPQINEYSFWDLNYRPACNDPRGMTCVAGSFWSDIYFLNTNPDVNGTSKYGVTIADGDSPPIIPLTLGGNGSTTFGSLTWFESMSIATAMGKRAITQSEFMTAMYGVTEATDRDTDPITTGLDAPRTSKWGVMQATGNLWTWAADRGGPYATSGWNANTEGFGSEYNAPDASRLGATWSTGVDAGSRSSSWYASAAGSSDSVSLRCACDHLQLE